MALRNQWDLATDDNFMRRVELAMCSAAIAIQAEATGTPNHTNRANYAKQVLNAPEQYMPLFSMAVSAVDNTLSSDSTDTAIQNNVSAVWNALAGTI
jgi:hypothetical protein